jgi:hypothetical protein
MDYLPGLTRPELVAENVRRSKRYGGPCGICGRPWQPGDRIAGHIGWPSGLRAGKRLFG